MKDKLVAFLACMMFVSTVMLSENITVSAFEYDTNAYMEEFYSKEVDYSLWDKFLKYDLCITDYDSLTDEEKELCEFIFETERSAHGTIRCERARRILKGEDVGERVTLESVTATRGGIIYPSPTMLRGIYNKYITAVPDIIYLDYDAADTSEYWLNDEGTKRILFSGWYLDYGYVEFGTEITENNEYLTDVVYDSNSGIIRATIEFDEEIIGEASVIEGWTCNYLPDGSIAISGGYQNFEDTTLIIPDKLDGNIVSSFYGYFCESNIKSFVSSENLKYISDFTFTNNQFIEEAIINSPCATIGSVAFENSALKTADINAKVIDEYAFSKCVNLENVTLHDGLEYIDNEVFEGCESLETVVLPETLKTIGEGAFLNTGIKSIAIPPTVEIIGAFDERTGSSIDFMGADIPATDPLTEESLCVFDQDCTIYGYAGTEAERYADEWGLEFVAVEKVSGDTNMSGSVDIADAVRLQSYLTGKYKNIMETADINGDGIINVFDMVMLRKELMEYE